jgi:hypothetical protein
VSLRPHLGGVPADLADALDKTYRDAIDHFLREEWDDALVDAGRLCEAALRYLEWKMEGNYTAIDGKRKPDRKTVVNAAARDTTLPPTLRAQMPEAIELIMDFRNNRDSAHLGDVEASRMDASTVVQLGAWVVGEIARVESSETAEEIQGVLDELAERHVPLIQKVGDTPIVLDPKMPADQRTLVLLYSNGNAAPVTELREWAEYGHSTRWRGLVLAGLEKKKLIHIDKDGMVHLLRPGEAEAQRILLGAAASP